MTPLKKATSLLTIAVLLLTNCTSDKELDFSQETIGDIPNFNIRSVIQDCDQFSVNNYSSSLIQEHSKSVGLIMQDQNTRNCTGTLISNANNKLYFLSAAHCVLNSEADIMQYLPFVNGQESTAFILDQLSESRLGEIIFEINDLIEDWYVRFGFECDSNANVLGGFNAGNLELKAINYQTDVALFEIKEAISPANKTQLKLAGWTRNETSSQAIDVHHPLGTAKKVAISNSGFTTFIQSHYVPDFPTSRNRNQFWWVNFSEGGVNHGSSGSSLINSDGRIVGFLSGGNDDNIANDINDEAVFGKFSQAWFWSANSANHYEPNRTLQYWLDPAGNSQTADSQEFYHPPSNLVLSAPGTPCPEYGAGGPGGGINGNYSIDCGRFSLNWDQAYNISTIKIYRQEHVYTPVLVATLNGINTTDTFWQDDIVFSWAGESNFKYIVKSYDSEGNEIGIITSNTLSGGLISF